MIACYITLGLVLFLLLIGQIRLGALAEYDASGFIVKLKIGPFGYAVYPRQKKGQDDRKKVKKDTASPDDTQKNSNLKKKGGSLGLILDLIPVITEAAGELLRKIRMDDLELHLIWAADNPASAAMGYGAANAAVGMIYRPLDQAFRIQHSDIDISVDFEQTEPVVRAKAILTITVGQIVTLAVRYGMKALRIQMKRRKNGPDQNTKKEATAHE